MRIRLNIRISHLIVHNTIYICYQSHQVAISSAAMWAVVKASVPSTWGHLAKQGQEGHPGAGSGKGQRLHSHQCLEVTGRAPLPFTVDEDASATCMTASERGPQGTLEDRCCGPREEAGPETPCALVPCLQPYLPACPLGASPLFPDKQL